MHNNAAAAIRYEVCNYHVIPTTKNTWQHRPNTMAEKDKTRGTLEVQLKIHRLRNIKGREINVAIGALAANTNKSERHPQHVPGKHKMHQHTKTAPLFNAYILRETLDLPDSG